MECHLCLRKVISTKVKAKASPPTSHRRRVALSEKSMYKTEFVVVGPFWQSAPSTVTRDCFRDKRIARFYRALCCTDGPYSGVPLHFVGWSCLD